MKRTLIATLVFVICITSFGYALNVDSHMALNAYIAQHTLSDFSLDSYLKNQLGLPNGINEKLSTGFLSSSQEVWKWIRDGGQYEDKPQWSAPYLRSRNHFHDPLLPLSQAGYTAFGSFCDAGHCPESAILWAIGPQYSDLLTIPLVGTIDLNPGGDWSWGMTRQNYYNALTSTGNSGRNANFGKTFLGLGQLMHLVEDMSVPEHTRNQFHGFGGYEGYVSAHPTLITNPSSSPKVFDLIALGKASAFGTAAPVPIANLFDTRQYNGANPGITIIQNIGLAEYTNANFVTEDTLFRNFPYPSKASSVMKQNYVIPDPVFARSTVTRKYYKKIADGDSGYRLADVGYLELYLPDGTPYAVIPPMDNNVYGDYAQRLLPRAVGYSAGLLDYFFRGNIAISLPSSGIFSTAEDRNVGFTRITLLASNTSTNGDEMSNGTIELVARYRTLKDDPFQPFDLQASNDYTYVVVPEATGKGTIPKGTPAEIVFDNGSTAIIPVNAVDVSLQIVYHGTLGQENGAVAVGMKSISDPTPVELVNNMDKICLYGQWYDAGSQAAIDQVGTDKYGNPLWDIYLHNLANIYIKISPESNPVEASASNYTFQSTILNAGFLLRAFILGDTDNQIKHSHTATVVKTTSSDTFTHASDIFDGIWSGYTIKSQIEYSGDTAVCNSYGFSTPCTIRHAPPFYAFRSFYMWGPTGTIFDNPKYPINTSCDWQVLQ